jgi:Flp pilus assembly secretin CpaC
MSGDIPYLSKIPVIGTLFRSRSIASDRSELIILMHPEVVNTPSLLVQTRKNEERRTYLGSDLENQLLPMEVRKAIPVKQAANATTTTTTTVKTTSK